MKAGFGLPLAVFVVLILALVGVAVNRLMDSSQQNYSQQVAGARAWLAAVSGSQVVMVDTLATTPCQCVNATRTISFAVDGLQNCQAVVTCNSFVVDTETFCDLVSTSSCDGGNGSRTLEARVR
ncbi:hypothetical protein [Oceanobacter mangrovi]|uniref:hypothetical protein n=1 Tax=Oceanobacter mangrovi TaxID=2862510 RepID=UPI001C8D1DD6|nr:hypothetical protein [Oceanobacter mangrovi]